MATGLSVSSSNCLFAPEIDDEDTLGNLARLNAKQLIDYNTALLMWKSKSGLPPSYMYEKVVPVKSVHSHETRMLNLVFSLRRKI